MDEEQSEPGRLVDRRPPQANKREAEAVTRREARGARRHRGHLTSRGRMIFSHSDSLSELYVEKIAWPGRLPRSAALDLNPKRSGLPDDDLDLDFRPINR